MSSSRPSARHAATVPETLPTGLREGSKDGAVIWKLLGIEWWGRTRAGMSDRTIIAHGIPPLVVRKEL